ncbi:hypothetical protein FA15DRAFT_711051 [Coprinopsis marcescibilis]|uniref:Uncharacterized protein n=1 Tax=Coprinopsis marcescibilis TaxID=230819 RepID=A0A5C3KAR7_COPMA|nr:hypothetical protein FA15DRAFT_711051 [Coprinopsis marcescibilis]
MDVVVKRALDEEELQCPLCNVPMENALVLQTIHHSDCQTLKNLDWQCADMKIWYNAVMALDTVHGDIFEKRKLARKCEEDNHFDRMWGLDIPSSDGEYEIKQAADSLVLNKTEEENKPALAEPTELLILTPVEFSQWRTFDPEPTYTGNQLFGQSPSLSLDDLFSSDGVPSPPGVQQPKLDSELGDAGTSSKKGKATLRPLLHKSSQDANNAGDWEDPCSEEMFELGDVGTSSKRKASPAPTLPRKKAKNGDILPHPQPHPRVTGADADTFRANLQVYRYRKNEPMAKPEIRSKLVEALVQEHLAGRSEELARANGWKVTLEELAWVIMGAYHISGSDSEPHVTVRGVHTDTTGQLVGTAAATLHVYESGRWVFHPNGGRYSLHTHPRRGKQGRLNLQIDCELLEE